MNTTKSFDGECQGEAWIKVRTIGRVKADHTPGRTHDIPENCYPDETNSEVEPESFKAFITVCDDSADPKRPEIEITKEDWEAIKGLSEAIDEAIEDMTDKALGVAA